MGAGDSDAAAGRHWLDVLDGAGRERTITETLALTLWDPNGLRAALTRSSELLATTQPDAIQLHAGPTELLRNGESIALAVRALCPDARLWIGVGADGTIDDYAEGRAIAAQVVEPLSRVAALAQSLGAELFVLDPEGQWKRAKEKDAEGLARDVSLSCAERAPDVVQAVTTFDHPSFHAAFPWRGFLGPGSKASLFLPQVYAGAVSSGQQLVAPHRGALPRRAETSQRSIAAAVRAGMIRGDSVGADGRDVSSRDVDIAPYVQGHSVHEHATTQLLLESPIACVWASMARMDRAGIAAFSRAARARKRLWSRPGIVRELQRELGLTQDGVLGPLTAAAIDREYSS